MAADKLPPFNEHGNLPDGDYWPSQDDFESRFVAVEASTTRTAIYEGFKAHRTALLGNGGDPAAPCLLDGSYTTKKLNPNDIDLVVEVDEHRYRSNPGLQALLAGPKVKDDYQCDAYPLLVYPNTHPDYHLVTEKARQYWHRQFGRDRSKRDKGRVWTHLGGFR